jgi:hypothetical protein
MRRALLVMSMSLICTGVASAQVVTTQPARTSSSIAQQGETDVSAQGRALRPDDYYRMRSVGSARISPDGEWVTYTVSLPIEETNGDETESWVGRTNGSRAPVRIHRTCHND